MKATLFLCVLTLSSPAEPAVVAGDEQDIVFLHPDRPHVLRLHLQVGDQPFRAGWDKTIGHLFHFLDADDSGFLDDKERKQAPSVLQWLQMVRGDREIEPEPAPTLLDFTQDPTAKQATPEQFARYYLRAGAGPLQVRWGQTPGGADRPSAVLFEKLDRDHDGKLARAELLAAETVLHLWDLDGDEIVLLPELQPGLAMPPMTFYPQRGPSTPVQDFPFHVVGESGLFARLVKRYDKDKDNALDAGELRLGKKTFARLDADGDGKVTQEEWKDEALSPHLELILPLGPGVARDVTMVPKPKKARPVRRSPAGAALVPFAGQQLEVVQVEGAKVRAVARDQALGQFRSMDGNRDKVLDGSEIFQPPFALVPVSRLADRDGDGKLSEKEYAGFLDLRADVQKAATFLTVADQGKSLLGTFDADHDGRLSRRELKSAWKRLEPWEPAKGKGFGREDVPRQWQLLVSHGAPPVVGNNGRSLRLPPRGPVWFQKMDRNRDGDVSATEFLGKAADFRTIDADRDGLIDPDEATRADARFRSGR